MNMKRVNFTGKANRRKLLHIEAEGCIVNIQIGLSDSEGHTVTSIQVRADQYAGDPHWHLADFGDAQFLNVRVAQETTAEQDARQQAEREEANAEYARQAQEAEQAATTTSESED